MNNKHGDFVWYELLTGDVRSADAFYSEILGWSIEKTDFPDMDYRLASAEDATTREKHDVAGLMQLTEEMLAGGAHPVWLGYIGVDDVDASVEGMVADGGNVMMPAVDIPGVGRMAMLTDPQGVPFYVMKDSSGSPSMAFANDLAHPGHCAWNELATTDLVGAWEFYGHHFGWSKDGEMDMGPMGSYQFIRHGDMIGAIMTKPEEMPVPMWSFYFRVTDIDAAAEKIGSSGGQVMHGPHEIPGGEFIISALDPTGAMFSLVGPRV